MTSPRHVTFVVPVLNEAESVATLHREVCAVMETQATPWDLVFVDDGSTDDTPRVLAGVAAADDRVRVLTFRRNFGKSAALDAGFKAARGDVVVTMDADLQDDPAEVPRLLGALETCDVVSGWKERRRDPLGKTLPSRFFNAVVRRASGVPLRDFNCGFKAYRAEALEGLTLYGELHRFVPVILHFAGFRIGEVAVHHRPRRFGVSKYGLERLFKGALDLLTVMLTVRFNTRPLHVFGALGGAMGALGTAILLFLSVRWLTAPDPIGTRPLFFLGILLCVSGVQIVTTGLIAELIQRQAEGRRPSWRLRSNDLFDQASDELAALDPRRRTPCPPSPSPSPTLAPASPPRSETTPLPATAPSTRTGT